MATSVEPKSKRTETQPDKNGQAGLAEERLAAMRTPIGGSKKVYAPGRLHSELRVPMRRIELAPTPAAGASGAAEANPPLSIYDTSGPYTDPDVAIDVRRGLSPLRLAWIKGRGDVEAYAGRAV